MSDVQFDEEQALTRYAAAPQKRGGIIGMLISRGIAKDERTAQLILLVVIAVCVIIMGFVLFSGGGKPSPVLQQGQGMPTPSPASTQ